MKKLIAVMLVGIMMIMAVACTGNNDDYQNTTHEVENNQTEATDNDVQNTTEDSTEGSEATEPEITEPEVTEPEDKTFTIKLSFALTSVSPFGINTLFPL